MGLSSGERRMREGRISLLGARSMMEDWSLDVDAYCGCKTSQKDWMAKSMSAGWMVAVATQLGLVFNMASGSW